MSVTLSDEQLYRDYHDKVFAYIRSRVNNYYDAEDLCEDVFVKVYKKKDTFDESKSSISTWIYNITKNTVIDFYRTSHEDLELKENAFVYEPEEEIDEDTLNELAKALEKLPPVLRDIIILRYYEEMSLKDIAAKMNMSYGVVKLRHREALFRLRGLIKE